MEKIINVMWLCSKPTNKYLTQIDKSGIHYGGWIDSILSVIQKSKKIHVDYVFFVKKHGTDFKKMNIDGVEYYPVSSHRDAYEISKRNSVIHVFGTENKIINEYILKYKNNKTVVWLQGIVSEYSKYYLNGLSDVIDGSKISNGTLNKVVIYINYLLFKIRGKAEKKVLKSVKYVIGRTEWDKKVSLSINPKLKYYYCQEILRDCFYKKKRWNNISSNRYSIYVSQANYPIKGFHNIISALGKLKIEFPSLSIRISGENILNSNNRFTRMGINYAGLIRKLLIRYNLQDNVKFIGTLDSKGVKKELLNNCLFLLCSNIENSPNSFGEALLTGTPIVSTNIGGVSCLTDNGIVHYYYNEESLIKEVKTIFKQISFAEDVSKQREVANKIYSKSSVLKNLEYIYFSIEKEKT